LPIEKRKRSQFAVVEQTETPKPDNVPSFFPPFPPEHTYRATSVSVVKRHKNAVSVREASLKTRQAAATSLTKVAGALERTGEDESSPSSTIPTIPFPLKPITFDEVP